MPAEKRKAASTALMLAVALEAAAMIAKVIACNTPGAGIGAQYCSLPSGGMEEVARKLRSLLTALEGDAGGEPEWVLPPPPEVPEAVVDQLKQRGRT